MTVEQSCKISYILMEVKNLNLLRKISLTQQTIL